MAAGATQARLLAARADRCGRPREQRALVEVERPRQDLRRLAALAEPGRRAQAAPVRPRRRRRRLRHRARPHARARRRIGLRQEHGGAPARRPVRADARQRRLRRRSSPAPAVSGRRCDPAPHADDLPGSVREPQPALEGEGHRRRAAARARLRRRRGRRRPGSASPSASASCCESVGLAARGRREVPAPVLGRPAAAHLDRARARDPARVPGLRRADVGARRVGAGAGPQHHEGPAATRMA